MDAANGTNSAAIGSGNAAPSGSGGAVTAPAPGAHTVALAPNGTERRSLAEVNANSPTFTGALGSCESIGAAHVSALAAVMPLFARGLMLILTLSDDCT